MLSHTTQPAHLRRPCLTHGGGGCPHIPLSLAPVAPVAFTAFSAERPPAGGGGGGSHAAHGRPVTAAADLVTAVHAHAAVHRLHGARHRAALPGDAAAGGLGVRHALAQRRVRACIRQGQASTRVQPPPGHLLFQSFYRPRRIHSLLLAPAAPAPPMSRRPITLKQCKRVSQPHTHTHTPPPLFPEFVSGAAERHPRGDLGSRSWR